MGFKEYCNNHNNNAFNKENEKKVQNIYNQYKDKSEDELFNELLSKVAQQKKDGTYNYETICNIIKKVSPFLTDEQKNKINDLLKKIKD